MGKSSEFRNFVWNLIGTTVNAFMSLVYQVIVTRVNGLEATGIFSVCFSFSLIVYTFSNLGGRVFEVADLKGDDSTYYTLKWFTGGISMAFSLAFSWLCGYEREKTMLIMLLMLVRIVESFSDTVYAVWQKAERLDLVGISYVLKNFIAIVMFAVLDVLTRNLIFATAAMALGTVAVYYLFDYVGVLKYGAFRLNCSNGEWKKLFKNIYYFIAFNFVAIVISNLPKFIADFYYTNSQMGYVGILMMIPTFVTLLGQLIVQAGLTRITECYYEGKLMGIQRIMLSMFAMMLAIGAVLCVGALLLGIPILNYVYGLDFAAYRGIMLIAICVGIVNAFVYILSATLTVMKRTRQQFLLNILSLFAEGAIIITGISSNSINSVFTTFFAAIAVEFGLFYMYYVLIHKKAV